MNFKAFALSLALGLGGLCSTSATFAEEGTTMHEQTFQDWIVRNVCWFETCSWRAVSMSTSLDTIIFIDYKDSGETYMFLSSLKLSDQVINSWDKTDHDEISIDYRVDRHRIIKSTAERYLDRSSRTLQTYIRDHDFSNLLDDMRRGQYLRIRKHVNQESFVETFSLKGLSAALRFIEKKKPKSTSPESFFEDGMI